MNIATSQNGLTHKLMPTMTKRKADGDPPSKPKPKKPSPSDQQNAQTESPAAKAYRRRRAAKLAQIASDVSAADPETHDVYDFSSTLPSPPPSTRQTPPAVPKADNTVLEDDQAAHNDNASVEYTPTVSGRVLDESTLLDILCFHCDDDLATDAFAAIMQHAAAAAKPGDEFGVLFLKSFITELASTPINQDWLTEIIGLLQQNLDSLCDRAKCQIRSLGKLALPERERLEPPVDEMELDDTEVPSCTLSSYTREATENIENIETIENKPTGKSANDEKYLRDWNNIAAPVQSKKSRRKNKDTQQSAKPTSKHSITTQKLTTSDDIPRNPKTTHTSPDLQKPEASISTPYELFVRSATAANCFATDQNGKVTKAYNKRVRRLWTRIEREHTAAWVKLFNARPDDVPLVIKGEGLLWSQDLVSKLLPNDCKPKPEHTD
jgi:hypothetical protein